MSLTPVIVGTQFSFKRHYSSMKKRDVAWVKSRSAKAFGIATWDYTI